MRCVTGFQNITVKMCAWNLPEKYWILGFNILEQHEIWVTLSHSKYTKPMKGNCLTVSNLKLDDVFSDVFSKSSRSITEQVLQHPREKFDVSPFVDGVISKEQAAKLRQCFDHIAELQKHIAEVAKEILCLNDKYEPALNLIRTVPGFYKNPLATIQVLSEIGGDMSVFPQLNTSSPRLDVVLVMIKATEKSNPLGFPVLGLILSQF
jgi:hypothetical protein